VFDPSDTRLRVVTLLDSLGSGGAERVALELATGFDPARIDSIMCVSRSFDAVDAAWLEAESRLRDSGIRVLQLPRRRTSDLLAWRPLMSLLRSERVHVLHAHMFGSSLWGSVIGRAAGVPAVVTHDHGWVGPRSRAEMALQRQVIARASDAVIAVSRHTLEQLIERVRIPAEKLVFIANGIAQPPEPAGASIRRELGIGADDPVIGSVGMMRAQKALEVLIEAVAILVRDGFPTLVLALAGQGPERPRLEAVAAGLGITDHVRWLGLRTDIPDVIATFDVAASSSDFEGSPLAIMEFMAAARPIVATAVGGVPDLIEDGVHGRLVPPRDPHALAGAIAELLRDRARAAEMGQRARERRESEFAIRTMVQRVEALYHELLGRSARREPDAGNGSGPARSQPGARQAGGEPSARP
jgi:glycosyltransferase involved in cell wall biosynthesis